MDFYLIEDLITPSRGPWVTAEEDLDFYLYTFDGKRIKNVDYKLIENYKLPKYAYKIWDLYNPYGNPRNELRNGFIDWCGSQGRVIANEIEWSE